MTTLLQHTVKGRSGLNQASIGSKRDKIKRERLERKEKSERKDGDDRRNMERWKKRVEREKVSIKEKRKYYSESNVGKERSIRKRKREEYE